MSDQKILKEYAKWREQQNKPSNQLKTLRNSVSWLDKDYFFVSEEGDSDGNTKIVIEFNIHQIS